MNQSFLNFVFETLCFQLCGMASGRKTFVWAGLGVAALYFIQKYARKASAAQLLNVKIRGINLTPLSSAKLIVELINPTSMDISFFSIVLDLSIDGYPVSTLSYQKNGIVKGNSSTTIAIPIAINYFDASQFLIQLLMGRKKPKTISVKGSVNSMGIAFPVDITQNIS